MKAEQKEVKIELCHKHKDTYLTDFYPGYFFNQYLQFPARTCRMQGCSEDAFYSVIGITFPDAVGDISRKERVCTGAKEIFREAKAIMDGGAALDRLTQYLKTRIIPSHHKELVAEKLLHHHAAMTLKKLGIDPNHDLSDNEKHCILKELNLYPEELE